MFSGTVLSRRLNCKMFSIISLTRFVWVWIISVSLTWLGSRFDDSASNWSAWLIAPSGFRISWAILAVSLPSDASFICCACWVMRTVSSRKMSVASLFEEPNLVKLGSTSVLEPLVRNKLGSVWGFAFHDSSNSNNSCDKDFRGFCCALSSTGNPSICQADWFINLTRFLLSTTMTPDCSRLITCSLSSAMFARSIPRCSASFSVSLILLDRTWDNSAVANTAAPRKPACA